jgi:GH18 family chitinase
VIGYYPEWAVYGRDFYPADVPAEKYTHLIYSFLNLLAPADIDADTTANASDSDMDGDGVANISDTDIDGDYIPNTTDADPSSLLGYKRCTLADTWADLNKPDPDNPSYGNGVINQMKHLKVTKNANLKLMFSIGGATWSSNFASISSDTTQRKHFVASCVGLMRNYGFDGMDLDWEFPANATEGGYYLSLMQEFRSQLDAAETGDAKQYELAAAVMVDPGTHPQRLNLAAIGSILDWVGLMNYDYNGAWGAPWKTNHNAPLYRSSEFPNDNFTVKDTIDAYYGGGAIPYNKLVMGYGFYGRGFAGVPNAGVGGLYQNGTGPSPAHSLPSGVNEAGIADYEYVKSLIGAPGWTRYFDDEQKVPYLFNASTGVWYSYDDADSAKAKMALMKRLGMAGVMVWDLSNEDSNAAGVGHTLTTAIDTALYASYGIAKSGSFTESGTNGGTGAVSGSVAFTLTGDTYKTALANGSAFTLNTDYTVSNIPAGLTPVLTKMSDTVASLTLTGNAASHTNANDVSNLTVEFRDPAFAIVTKSDIANSTTNNTVINFNDLPVSITYAPSGFTESLANNGSIGNSITATLSSNGDTYAATLTAGSNVVFSNVPGGLTGSVVRTSSNLATLSLNGNATNHAAGNSITNVGVAFQNDAFTGGSAAAVANNSKTNIEVTFASASSIAWSGNFTESSSNNGIVTGTRIAALTGDTFANAGGSLAAGAHFTTANIPNGLSMAATVNGSGTIASFSLSGGATPHTIVQSVSNLTISLLNAAFSNTLASNITDSSNALGVVTFVDKQLSYSTLVFGESDANNGSITDTITVLLSGDTFVTTLTSGGNVLFSNIPAGLSAVVTRNSTTQATLSLSGAATNHANSNDITNVTVAFQNAAFTGGSAATVVNSTKSNVQIDFDDPRSIVVAQSGGTTNVSEPLTTDTFTVALSAQPVSSVVVSTTSGDITESTVAPSTLTFTNANWNTPQTVTVTGVDDVVADGNIAANTTIAVVDASSSDEYDTVVDALVSVVTSDNDTNGITLTPSPGISVIEGSNNTFSVALMAQPLNNVAINLVSNDTGAATIGTSALTFTPANWNTPQVVTVTAVQDADTLNESVTITASVNAASSSNEYDTVPNATEIVSVTDDDVAGFSISATALTMFENAGTGTFTAQLSSQPISNVVFSVNSSNTGEATVSPSALTFTPANWSTPQTVMVTGVDDNAIRNDSATVTVSVVDASSDNSFDPLPDQSIAITLTDNDIADVVISKTTMTLPNEITGDTFTVVLAAQPASNVVISTVSSNTLGATVSPAILTFTPVNWNIPQTVTVSPYNNNSIPNTAAMVTISVVDASSDNAFDPVPDKTVTIVVTNDDVANISISKISSSLVEEGVPDTVSVSLTAQPATNVVFAVANTTSGVTTTPSTITFTSLNWNSPQVITLTALGDTNTVSESGTVRLSVVDASSDDSFDSITDKTITVSVTDNDTADVVISQTAITLPNEITTGTFTVVLATQPSSNVVISTTSSNTAHATVSPATLTFTPANWNTPQTVIITPVNNNTIANTTAAITISVVDASSDDSFDPVADKVVAVTVTNDDMAGITITPTTLVSVTEGTTTNAYTVVLNAGPVSNVVISTISNIVGVTTNPATLTFTPANWSTPQHISLVAATDENSLNESGVVTFSVVDANSDDVYDLVSDTVRSINTVDIHTPGISIGTFTNTISENAGTSLVPVSLVTQPSSAVVLSAVNNSVAEMSLTPTTITFLPSNWNIPQYITITAVNDFIDRNDTGSLTISVIDVASSDEYDAVLDSVQNLACTDDDTSGITVIPVDSVTGEDGDTGSFRITLNSQPTADVLIPLSSSNALEGVVPTSITITPANWSALTNIVTVTGVNDSPATSDGVTNYTIITGDPSSSDVNYNTLIATDTADIVMQNQDNDPPGITVTAVGNSTTESSGTIKVRFSLLAQPTGGADVTIPVSISNTAEATLGSVVSVTIANANWNNPVMNEIPITGVDDAIDDGDVSFVLETGKPISIDPAYNALTATSVSDPLFTNTDNDTAGLHLSASSLSVGEGVTGVLGVYLDTQPTGNVIVDTTVSPTVSLTRTPVSLTFTPANWSTPQNISYMAAEDMNSTSESYTGVFVVSAASVDTVYKTLPQKTISVTVADNESTLNDIDGDAILNTIENAGFNQITVNSQTGADGNGDGILDVNQQAVAGLPIVSDTALHNGIYTTLEVLSPACSFISAASSKKESDLLISNTLDFPYGLFDYTLGCSTPGSSTTVRMYIGTTAPTNLSSLSVIKYKGGVYSTISSAQVLTKTIGGVAVPYIEYSITDGGVLDADGVVNGVIQDPVGFAIASGTVVITPVVATTPTASSSGGGGGGGGSATAQSVAAQQLSKQDTSKVCTSSGSIISKKDTASVKVIQKFLQSQGYIVAVDGNYDILTTNAIKLFQNKYKKEILTPSGFKTATGIWGPATTVQSKKLGMCGGTMVVKKKIKKSSPTKTVETVESPVLNNEKETGKDSCLAVKIVPGATGDEVKHIQKFLQSQGYIVAADGNYDILTTNAIKSFQNKYFDEILKPQGFTKATGLWGAASAKKASSLGLCEVK